MKMELVSINEFELAELIGKFLKSGSFLGITVEVDDSMPELTIKLPKGQVFNLCVKRVK